MNQRLLLIDDDEIMANMLSSRLVKRGYEVDTSQNGELGLKMLSESDYDLVLLDSVMPIISGEEVLFKIRSQQEFRLLPVIMITSNDKDSEIVKLLNLGANDYLTKPLNIDILEARVKGQLALKNLFIEDLAAKELKAIKAMIATYNHEINNPLAAAMGFIEIEIEMDPENKRMPRVLRSLKKASEIIKQMRDLTEGNPQIIYEQYTSDTKTVKIKKAE